MPEMTLAKRAVETGLCPICGSPMSPGVSGVTSACSNPAGCRLGVVPKCETYRPLSKLENKKKRDRDIQRFPLAKKMPGKELFNIEGSAGNWSKVQSVCLRDAKIASKPREFQRPMFDENLPENKPPKVRVGAGEIIARTDNGKLWLFEKTNLFSDR